MMKILIQKLKIVLNSIYLIILSILLLFYLLFFNYISVGECTINRNIFNNNIEIDTISGFKISAPWIQKSNIDTKPMRICIECDCRNKTCVLVSFNPNGYKEFIEKEGFAYYWWRNRFSFNFGHTNENRGINDILKGYCFDNEEYTFITKKVSF